MEDASEELALFEEINQTLDMNVNDDDWAASSPAGIRAFRSRSPYEDSEKVIPPKRIRANDSLDAKRRVEHAEFICEAFRNVINKGDLTASGLKYFRENFVDHVSYSENFIGFINPFCDTYDQKRECLGRDNLLKVLTSYAEAFPDCLMEIGDVQLEEDEKGSVVVARYTYVGTKFAQVDFNKLFVADDKRKKVDTTEIGMQEIMVKGTMQLRLNDDDKVYAISFCYYQDSCSAKDRK